MYTGNSIQYNFEIPIYNTTTTIYPNATYYIMNIIYIFIIIIHIHSNLHRIEFLRHDMSSSFNLCAVRLQFEGNFYLYFQRKYCLFFMAASIIGGRLFKKLLYFLIFISTFEQRHLSLTSIEIENATLYKEMKFSS